jgi:hypothetical protein
MNIQNLEPTQIGKKLSLRWVNMTEEFHNIFLEVAQDSEFIKQARIFLLPRCNSVELDVGGGFWYVRAGVPKGDSAFGRIDWTGIIGPLMVISPKQPPPLTQSLLTVTKTAPITNGHRIYVKGYDTSCHAFVEVTESTFHSSKRKSIYTFDGAMNHFFDIPNLDPTKSYTVRLWGFLEWPTESIEMVGQWISLNNIKAIPVTRSATKRVTNTDIAQLFSYTGQAQDEKLTTMRFASQKEYVQWLSQKNKHTR